MGGSVVNARNAEAAVFVSTGGDAVNAKIAKVCAQILIAAYHQHIPCLFQVKLLLVANH